MGKYMRCFLILAGFILGILLAPADTAFAEDRGSYTLEVGERQQFEAFDSAPYAWSATDPSIISIEEVQEGKYAYVTGRKPGTTILRVTSKKLAVNYPSFGQSTIVDRTDTWTITVQNATDALYPVGTIPRNGASDFSVAGKVQITYDRDILKGGNFSKITLRDNTAGKNVSCSSSCYQCTLTIAPSSKLEKGHSYTATVPAEAVKSRGDIGCVKSTVSFTAENIEITPKVLGGGDGRFYGITAAKDGYVAVGNIYPDKDGWAGTEDNKWAEALIVKYNEAGKEVWKKSLGGMESECYASVAAVGDGYVAVGYLSEESFGNGDWTGEEGNGKEDAILVKYDLKGNVVWKKHFGGKGQDYFESVAADGAGFVAAGYSAEESFGNGDWAGEEAEGKEDAILVKYDRNGNVKWKKHLGGGKDSSSYSETRFNSVAAAGGGYVAAGVAGANCFGSGDWTGMSGKGLEDGILVKFDSDGNVKWKKNFGGSDKNSYLSVTAASDGYVAAGFSDGGFGQGDWSGVKGWGGRDAVLVKYDWNGNVEWRQYFGGNGKDEYRSVTAVKDGYVAAGSSAYNSFGTGDWQDNTGRGGDDAAIVKYDLKGRVKWKKNFGGSSRDCYWAVASSGSNSYMAAGDSNSGSFGDGDWSGESADNELMSAIVVKYTETANPLTPDGITLNHKSLNMKIGNRIKLSYTLTPSGTAAAVTFASSNSSVATVDANGWVTAVRSGTANITASTPQGLHAACKVTVAADSSTDDPGNASDFSYKVLSDGTLEISKYKGTDSTIIVPEKIKKRRVTKIGKEAFQENRRLKTIKLPEGLKSIGKDAFYDCINLKSIKLPDSLKSIGANAFYECNDLKSIKLPKGLKSIGQCTFYECNDLKSIKLPKGLKSIGQCTFYGCNDLKSVIISEGVISIEKLAFYRCINLKSIKLPKSLKSIEDSAFYECSRLKSVIIPEGVTSIGEFAFYDCDGLKGIKLPKSLKSIEWYAFYDCDGLKDIKLPNSLKSIGEGAFGDCEKLQSVTLGAGVRKIGKEAFIICPKLKKITIKSTKLKSVGKNAFKGINAKARIKVPRKKLAAYKRLMKGKGQGRKVKIVK